MKPDPNQKNPKKTNSTSVSTQTISDQKRPTDQPYTSPDSSRPTGSKGGKGGKPTGRSTISSSGSGSNGSDLPPFLGEQFARVDDPNNHNTMPQYAVLKQKVVTLTEDQYNQLKSKKLSVGALVGGKGKMKSQIEKVLGSLNESFWDRVLLMDCPEVGDDGKPLYTVLLDWVEDTSVQFPQLRLVDVATNKTFPISQANNYLLVSFSDDGGGTNNPPARPPVTGSDPLNVQPSDFRPLASGDALNYQQHRGQDTGPAVAVLDTGLKFNLHNQHEEGRWPDRHVYRDAGGQERRFTLAYQEASDNDCGPTLKGNHLGYCSLQSYRQDAFIRQMKLLKNMHGPYSPADIMNSPFDDCVIYNDTTAPLDDIENIKYARHGTTITAIIQQYGDDVPVLPVKSFDNLGYATLFDVLNGLNYILHRCEKSNIRVVNASWVFGRDEPLLKKKIRQLMKAGVLVIAAAGNKGQTPNRNLDVVKVYPACYSNTLPNVITVTTVRETHVPPKAFSPKEDTVVDKILAFAEKIHLSGVLDIADEVADAVAGDRGYVAVENYSTTFVNVGVVSKRGRFPSPFQDSPDIKGSSFACAYATSFVVRQLRTDDSLLALVKSGTQSALGKARKKLFKAMSGVDPNLAQEYVAGGHFLDGYVVD